MPFTFFFMIKFYPWFTKEPNEYPLRRTILYDSVFVNFFDAVKRQELFLCFSISIPIRVPISASVYESVIKNKNSLIELYKKCIAIIIWFVYMDQYAIIFQQTFFEKFWVVIYYMAWIASQWVPKCFIGFSSRILIII